MEVGPGTHCSVSEETGEHQLDLDFVVEGYWEEGGLC